ncbi:hypothetical protein PHJA_001260100 [Phtheirospermum japonicum]|uniref:Uncharacterized protein n=1 Tax=Phtheirospermum japonicum TaxID=374723 RepID=A0A830CA94_9LAMI|nr:hypothetical protein PHJA_001260100 [Phtheirospermum japonicum]
MAARSGCVAAVVLVVVCWLVLYDAAEGQQQLGPCLIACGEKVMMCATACGLKGGKTPCYEGCGNGDIGCVNSCLKNKPPAEDKFDCQFD